MHKSRRKVATSPRTLEDYALAVRDFLAWYWPPGEPAPARPSARPLERLAGHEPRQLRDRVAVRLMGECGLRVSEAAAFGQR